MSDVVLKLTDLNAHYGHIHALRGISMEVKAGQIVTLLGANGAGKSTTCLLYTSDAADDLLQV